jgi:hypothetical protein
VILNRRKFFKWLGVGAAVAAVAPYVDLPAVPACVAPKTTGYTTYVMGENAFISSYADYLNFSDFPIASAIDDVVADSAKELGYRHSLLLNELVSNVGA